MANEPITREEILLNAIATGETAKLEPITREEMFLAKLGGADVKIPTPITRKEQFLQRAIEGGGTGGGDSAMMDAVIEGSATEVISNAKSVAQYKFYSNTELTTANLPKATSIGDRAFYGCNALTTTNFPVATSIGSNAFRNCKALTTVNFPMVESIGSYAFYDNGTLTTVNLPMVTDISSDAFFKCSALTTVILRNTGKVCAISDSSVFGNTPLRFNTGYIYVPSALVASYKAETNWSLYATQFRALEDYTVDGTITGELDPSKI